MIDSVGRIVFPPTLFGCSDPVIYNGPNPCLIHTSPAERGSIQEAGVTGESHSTFLPGILFLFFIKMELRAKSYVQEAIHQTCGKCQATSCTPAKTYISDQCSNSLTTSPSDLPLSLSVTSQI